MLFEIVSSRVLGRSRSERVGLARIRCKSLCRCDQLCLGYIELMGEFYLQVRLKLTKKTDM